MNEREISGLLDMLGSGHCFGDLKILQGAIERKGALARNYFERDENFCEFFSSACKSKKEIHQIREQIIEAIVKIIDSQGNLPYREKMPADHYARYLHALAILKADKALVPKRKSDYVRDAFVELWLHDDGSEEAWKTISAVSWFIAEAVKAVKSEEPIRE